MLELSKMQGLAGGSRAPLGLLLICLYLPGLFARSIEAPEEKVSPHSGKPSFTSLFNSGQPQPKPDPVNNELPRVLPRLPESPEDGTLPEGESEMPSQPPIWGWSPMDYWLSEDPQQGMEAAAEDYPEQVRPDVLPYFSSAYEASGPEDSEPTQLPGSSPLRTEAEAFAQHPFWFFIHRLLPGLPWGILSPSGSWGGGGAGTGWGRRPMPYPSGIWGSNSQLSGTSLGVNGRHPVASWGTNSPYPVGSWGGNGPYPAGSWGGNGPYPAGSWGGNGLYPAGSWGGNGPYPTGSWGTSCRYPAGSWGANCRNPAGSWRPNGRNPLPPGVRPPGRNPLPPGVRPPGRNPLPPGVRPPGRNPLAPGVRPPPGRNPLPPRVRPPGRNPLPPGARPPGSSGSLPNLSLQ
ncbi:uncharacterized protein C6orf15 homolog [Peromyscus leucopus]|uniref:uncharacterized protein C6orf15 homolog n=1 Tax=Peromyscus leucopus TaxID=10041 RepID=UPI0018852488|nr:uncharacterized protein C6orf15 homolog [Peromyscus leucopus]